MSTFLKSKMADGRHFEKSKKAIYPQLNSSNRMTYHPQMGQYYGHVTVLTHLRFYAIARPSVVCLSSATYVRPTQPVEMFGDFSSASPLGTVPWPSIDIHGKFYGDIMSKGNPSVGGRG